MKCNGPRIWNNINISIRDAIHVDIFKAKLIQRYLESYIQSIITFIIFCIRDIQFITDLYIYIYIYIYLFICFSNPFYNNDSVQLKT